MRRAVQVPARQIVQNAGEDGSLVVGKLMENSSYNWGFNAATGEYQDLVKAGVIDPAKVVRTALQDAASIAGLLITTEAMVVERPKDAPGSVVAIRSTGDPGSGITVVLTNPLRGAPTGAPGAGLGLIGLRERAELRGGRLEQRTDGSTFVLEAWLPWSA